MLSIARVLQPVFPFTGDEIRALMARQAQQLSPEHLEVIKATYMGEIADGTFAGKWDPSKLKTGYDLADAIARPLDSKQGDDFQGDDITLDFAARAFNVHFVVIDLTEKRAVHTDTYNRPLTACLAYQHKGTFRHYQALIGEDGNSLFFTSHLPPTLKDFLEASQRRSVEQAAQRLAAKLKQQLDEWKADRKQRLARAREPLVPRGVSRASGRSEGADLARGSYLDEKVDLRWSGAAAVAPHSLRPSLAPSALPALRPVVVTAPMARPASVGSVSSRVHPTVNLRSHVGFAAGSS
jgi:hypothetical protein